MGTGQPLADIPDESLQSGASIAPGPVGFWCAYGTKVVKLNGLASSELQHWKSLGQTKQQEWERWQLSCMNLLWALAIQRLLECLTLIFAGLLSGLL